MILTEDLILLLSKVQSLKQELVEVLSSDVIGKDLLVKDLHRDITKARVKVSEYFEKQTKDVI